MARQEGVSGSKDLNPAEIRTASLPSLAFFHRKGRQHPYRPIRSLMRAPWMEGSHSAPVMQTGLKPFPSPMSRNKKARPFTDAGRIDRFAPIQEKSWSVKQDFFISQIEGKRRQHISERAFPAEPRHLSEALPKGIKKPRGTGRRAKTEQAGIILRRSPLRNHGLPPERKLFPAAGGRPSGRACGGILPS